ncbi:MAG TPA: ubiquinol oxidase subunit II [Rhodopila sp.]|uniref:ubiquinol oxidase subunit II n=1 Tax=Rhodopila sp. TaxID=2480087 RepID=UPI002B7565A0|nr:ubiquinol oxidase subunit II [Rhodopila sp.]HVY15750.1 ubiquinol oxidase subunit II [Rhodopila sp.]
MQARHPPATPRNRFRTMVRAFRPHRAGLSRSALRRTAALVWLLPLLGLAGCKNSVLDPVGPIGTGDATILMDSVAIMLCIVVPVFIATAGFAFWFRAGNTRARYRPNFIHSGTIELVVWAIPLLVILLLGGVTWIGSHELDPAKPLPPITKPLRVQVVSLDWKWLFIYPDLKLASVNELTIPAGTPIDFTLTSASVMNAFFIPRLGSMIYTMNGMTVRLNLQADTAGTYLGESSHYSGDGFSGMRFDVHALPAEQFDTWVEATRQKGPVLDEAAYKALERQSLNVTPFTYRNADPTLFARIVAQLIPPAEGPPADTPHRDVSPKSIP